MGGMPIGPMARIVVVLLHFGKTLSGNPPRITKGPTNLTTPSGAQTMSTQVETVFLPYGAAFNKTPSSNQDKSSWWGSYWAGGWDLYLDNARVVGEAFKPAQQDS
ncbi:hypothetical protein ACUXQ2_004891 [Cupriavidus metallidurans]